MPILLQIDEKKTKDPKEFKKVCRLINILMEKAVVGGFFEKNWSDEALEEMETIGPLDMEESVDSEEDGEVVIKIGIQFAEA